MADHGIVCSMSRAGNVWDNAVLESFFSSLKSERTARKTYRTARSRDFSSKVAENWQSSWRRHKMAGAMSGDRGRQIECKFIEIASNWEGVWAMWGGVAGP